MLLYNFRVFYDPGDFYVDPEDLPETKYGGVAVAQGRKVIVLLNVNPCSRNVLESPCPSVCIS